MKIKGLKIFNIKILFKKRLIFGFKNFRIATNYMANSHMWLVATVLDTFLGSTFITKASAFTNQFDFKELSFT